MKPIRMIIQQNADKITVRAARLTQFLKIPNNGFQSSIVKVRFYERHKINVPRILFSRRKTSVYPLNEAVTDHFLQCCQVKLVFIENLETGSGLAEIGHKHAFHFGGAGFNQAIRHEVSSRVKFKRHCERVANQSYFFFEK